jgi:hypothetical protein
MIGGGSVSELLSAKAGLRNSGKWVKILTEIIESQGGNVDIRRNK